MKNKRIFKLYVAAFEIIYSFRFCDIYSFFSFLPSSWYHIIYMCRGSIIAIDDIIASDNIAALTLKALLEYNRINTIKIKNIYVYVYILRMISKRSHIRKCKRKEKRS